MSTITEQAVPAGTWGLDSVHSAVGFSVDYMAGTFNGAFTGIDARVEDGVLKGSAEVASVQVNDPNLEAHLQSPDFFDAERNPQLTFASKSISRNGNDVVIDGEITIKGHTEPVTITGTVSDPIADPFGGERFGLKLEAVVDRDKFGISWNNPLPGGGVALANEVKILANLQLVRAEA
jgi:polyisoprenoid-binding protein YceI